MTAETITYYQAHFTGEPRARCEQCGTVFAYWEDDDLTDHAETCRSCDDQWTTCNRCDGEGTVPVLRLKPRRWVPYECPQCAGSGLMRR